MASNEMSALLTSVLKRNTSTSSVALSLNEHRATSALLIHRLTSMSLERIKISANIRTGTPPLTCEVVVVHHCALVPLFGPRQLPLDSRRHWFDFPIRPLFISKLPIFQGYPCESVEFLEFFRPSADSVRVICLEGYQRFR